jgi:hypothetical protein
VGHIQAQIMVALTPIPVVSDNSAQTSEPNTPAVQAVVTTFPIRKYLGGELLGSKNGMKLIRN